MIYPEIFPEDRKNQSGDLRGEEKVFDRLKNLGDEYDIFYSRKFVTDGKGRKPEYEIDFIIAIPGEALVCLEVKGGLIQYIGATDRWTQSGHVMTKRPDDQATSAAHSILKSYGDIIGGMAIGWGLCFSDCDIKNENELNAAVPKQLLIDQMKLLYIDETLPTMFDFIKKQYPRKTGVRLREYNKFKNKLLRGIGLVQVLSSKIKYDNSRFIEMTKNQLDLFDMVAENKNVIATGPAGSGKTIVAKTVVQDYVNDDKTVLFLCYNRTLSNKLRYDFDKYENRVEIATFHSLARRIIQKYDKDWWSASKDKTGDFWDMDIPVKLEECLSFIEDRYDVLVIDEGQDFKEFWYEILFKLVKDDGRKFIFMDEMQNIFGNYSDIPNSDSFVRFKLKQNCRNTKNIVKYLSETIDQDIPSFEKSPLGDDIVVKSFKNQIEEQKYLLDEIKALTKEHEIDSSQILVLINSSKELSCLGSAAQAGGIPIVGVDNKGRTQKNSINYTTINTFKGLEADIVFVVDTHLINTLNKMEKIYTQASRARHKLYLLSN